MSLMSEYKNNDAVKQANALLESPNLTEDKLK